MVLTICVRAQDLYPRKTFDLHEYYVGSALKQCLKDIVKAGYGGEWNFIVRKNLREGCIIEVVIADVKSQDNFYGVINIDNAAFLLEEELILEDSLSSKLFYKGDMIKVELVCYGEKLDSDKNEVFPLFYDYPSRIIIIQGGNVYLDYGDNSHMKK